MRKLVSIFFILSFFTVILPAQNRIIDSLSNLVNTSSDTVKVLAICELIERKIDINDTHSINNLFTEGIEISKKYNFIKGLIKLYGHYGKLYYYKSDFEKAIENFFISLKYAEELGDKLLLAKINNNISSIFFDLENYEKAKEYSEKALQIGLEINDKRIITYCYLLNGNIHYVNEQTDSTEFYYKKALRVFDNIENKDYEEINDITLIYNNFGALYASIEEYDKALEYYHKALSINKKYGNIKRRTSIFNNNIADILRSKKEYKSALKYAFSSLQIADSISAKDIMTDSYFIISEIYSEQDDLENALFYLKSHINLKDSLQSGKTNEKITALQIEYKTKKHKQEIELLKRQKQITTLKWIIILTGISVMFIFFILILNKRRIKFKKDKLIAVQQQKLTELNLGKAQIEIKYKNKDLKNFTKYLEEKNKLIEKFQDGIVQLLTEKNEDIKNKKQTELLNMRILTDEDWLEFQLIFSGVYKGFLNKLEDKYPNLTEGEKRQLILIKSGLPGKHAAAGLGISHQAVQKAKRRLTLKLGLSETQDLKEIVNKLSENNEITTNKEQSKLLTMKILTDNDWLEFISIFSKAYEGFFNKLEFNFPNLTEGEKRQFILLKIGLSVKHAAANLGISVQAVQKARRRLALKLGLSETHDLKEIVNVL